MVCASAVENANTFVPTSCGCDFLIRVDGSGNTTMIDYNALGELAGGSGEIESCDLGTDSARDAMSAQSCAITCLRRA